MEELMRSLGGLEEQFASIHEDKTPFLQMLHQCIEPPPPPNQILLLQNQTIKQDPGHQEDSRREEEEEEASVVPQVKEKRKRKRTRAPKNKEEVETQRMTHIAVERNRRKQMNQHLSSLKSLMPPSFLQRGDQASIVGGAIEFIKELEQLLQSLESQKHKEGTTNQENPKTASCSSSTSSHACTTTTTTNSSISSISTSELDSFTARLGGGETSEVEATVIQNHVSLKVRCKRGIKGQILKAIVSIEALKLTILHLTISTNLEFVFYSFNLKIEDGCTIASANEIATAVHQIYEQINGEMKWSNLS